MESPIKSDFRLTRVTTSLAGVDIPAGTKIMLLPGAANRDPPTSSVQPSCGSTDRMRARTWPSRAACTVAQEARWRESRAE